MLQKFVRRACQRLLIGGYLLRRCFPLTVQSCLLLFEIGDFGRCRINRLLRRGGPRRRLTRRLLSRRNLLL